MKLIETGILGVVVLESPIYRDDRGQFQETCNERQFLELGLPIDWKQDNLSFSRKNVVRGLQRRNEVVALNIALHRAGKARADLRKTDSGRRDNRSGRIGNGSAKARQPLGPH